MKEWLALDKRSLGLFRICLGFVLLFDVFLRGLHFRAHYTSEGVLPLQQYLIQSGLTLRRWSVFFVNDTPLIVGLLMIVFFLSAMSLTVGYRTRLAGWLCWILILGIYRRNPLVNNGGDAYLPLLLMWGNFLPWGKTFAVDAGHQLEDKDFYYRGFPGFCYLIQVCLLYWFSAVLRTGVEWQFDGSALYYALHLTPLNTSLAPYVLLLGTEVLAFLTKATLLMEIFGPLLLLLPSRYARILGVVSVVVFHAGILVTLAIPMFAIFCILGPVGLLPSSVWQTRKGQRLAERFVAISAALRSHLPRGRLFSFPESVAKVLGSVTHLLPYLLMSLTLFHLYWGMYRANIRSPLSGVLSALSLDQSWGMFSPRPAATMGWTSAEARTESGRHVDLITGDIYDPQRLGENWGLLNYRWRTFILGPGLNGESQLQLYLRYLVGEWNKQHPKDLVVSAQYLVHPRTTQKRFLLGEEGVDVMTVYQR